MIIVDSREFKSKVVKYLFEADVEMQSLQLLSGDYQIGEDICIERKSVQDFVDSLVDKRIFEQLRVLKQSYKKPLLIVEGGEHIYSVRKVHPNAIRGLIASITLDYNVPIIFSQNEEDTANYIISLMTRSVNEPKPLSKVQKKTNLSDIQEAIVSNLPGVGIKSARKILLKFKTLKNLFNSSVEELKNVEGIGGKNAEKIIETATKEYEE
ncbi:3'-flap repair endonuclease Xpf [Candidatus Tiddalikarchaeum anstoanum]|nr:3'-flap repair endonuclease Xpf [Candidatus Tiddalikarchaeum anstoanum]